MYLEQCTFLLPVIPFSMERLYANLCISTCNEYKYIADVAVLCICGVDCTSVRAWKRDPSPVAQVSSFYIRVFLLKSKDGGCHNCTEAC